MVDPADRHLAAKRLVRGFIEKRGFQIIKGATVNQFLRARAVDLVIDVGANEGQYSRSLRRWGYNGDIVAFEPISAAFAKLTAHFTGDSHFTARHSAVGAVVGEASINIADYSVFSSIKATTALAERFDSRAATVRTEQVPVVPLDSVAETKRGKAVFLKIDTQGFEQEVLRGATETLRRCVGVQLELAIDHLYEGVWDFSEAMKFMTDAGFSLAQIRPTNPKHDDPVSALEFDCVFRRTDQQA